MTLSDLKNSNTEKSDFCHQHTETVCKTELYRLLDEGIRSRDNDEARPAQEELVSISSILQAPAAAESLLAFPTLLMRMVKQSPISEYCRPEELGPSLQKRGIG
ncbi:MAG: hypothetical protein JEY71_16360 [Sphaerochaeta sp.]|nr:hypothetical protein [Sphaerochaeta sp.]